MAGGNGPVKAELNNTNSNNDAQDVKPNDGPPNKGFQGAGRGDGGQRFPSGPAARGRGNFKRGGGPPRGRGVFRGGMRQGGGGQGSYEDGKGPGGMGPRNPEARLNEKLQQIAGSTVDLPPAEGKEKKFLGRCRLYIGNLTPDTSDNELSDLFKPFGETSELFINKEKMFAFIRLDYRINAERAKRELDGSLRKGRTIKVRFAPHSAAIKVKNLSPWVTNELLDRAFSVFGDIERAIVMVDERGKSLGEGVVEFARKPGAAMAMKFCQEGCFFLTSALKPVVVEQYDTVGDEDGHQEKNLPKKNPEFIKAREVGPRFAAPGSFEHEYGQRWKQLHDMKRQKLDALNREMQMEEEKLEAQMQYARYEHETEMLREQLRQREMDRDRQKREWELKERQREEHRQHEEERVQREQEDMQRRVQHQEEELRRRQQENNLFMQAHQLNSLLDQQEQALRTGQNEYDDGYEGQMGGGMGGAGGPNMPPDPKAFMEAYERHERFEQPGGMGGMGGMGGGMRGGGGARGRGQWARERGMGMDEYAPNKRRRY